MGEEAPKPKTPEELEKDWKKAQNLINALSLILDGTVKKIDGRVLWDLAFDISLELGKGTNYKIENAIADTNKLIEQMRDLARTALIPESKITDEKLLALGGIYRPVNTKDD